VVVDEYGKRGRAQIPPLQTFNIVGNNMGRIGQLSSVRTGYESLGCTPHGLAPHHVLLAVDEVHPVIVKLGRMPVRIDVGSTPEQHHLIRGFHRRILTYRYPVESPINTA